MLNLKKQSGLPIAFDGNAIIFGNGVTADPMQARTLKDARAYYMGKHATSRRKNLYLMYRNVRAFQDEAFFKKQGIRHDITVLFPGTLGGKKGEYIRTIGHTHPAAELYEVLHGTALFTLQEIDGEQKTFFIKASAGEKLIIPPGFGHSTLNIGNTPLILSDLFSDSIKSDYSFFKKHKGAAYWVCQSDKKMAFIKNPTYNKDTDIIIGVPMHYETMGLTKKEPLYAAFLRLPEKFSFLLDQKKAWNIVDSYGVCRPQKGL